MQPIPGSRLKKTFRTDFVYYARLNKSHDHPQVITEIEVLNFLTVIIPHDMFTIQDQSNEIGL